MPPLSQELEPNSLSSLGIKLSKNRNSPLLSADLWLDDKREDDGAEGLWRIHNDLYDLSDWIDRHPGGKDWIRLTKGTDITEAFESHHISPTAENLLPKFHIRTATSPRNVPYTFEKNGFYRTLKKRVWQTLPTIPNTPVIKTKLMTDILMILYLTTSLISVIKYNFILGMLAGLLLHLTVVAAHNFFHQKDNFRMYYFDLSFLSSREWRISHVMSHHLYTNTVNDLEISFIEPFLFYLPQPKTTVQKILAFVLSPGVYAFVFLVSFLKRIVLFQLGTVKELNKRNILPFVVLGLLYLLSGKPILDTFIMWFWIMTVGSFIFGFFGVVAAHHHPEIFHDGDTPRKELDWGLVQLDCVMDRKEITGSDFLVLTSFGDHALHHLFPTIDHSKLKYLYPTLKRTCSEFGVQFRMTSQFELILGQFVQLIRTKRNPHRPGEKWNWRQAFSLNMRTKTI